MCDGFFFHTDTNIDHRRVPNLTVFFARKGHVLPITTQATNYAPGDLVTRDLGGGLPHIGILVDKQASSGRYFVSATSVWAPKRKMSCSTGRLTATTATRLPAVTLKSPLRAGESNAWAPIRALGKDTLVCALGL